VKIEISPAAQETFREAQAEYRNISKQVAKRFAAEMRRIWRQLSRFPRSGTPIEEFRRIVLNGFPYSVIYDIDDDVVRVAAIRRQQQEPDYWASDHE
jgi:plasmid stabilization system protein ParE